jgi:hypothetical protein
MHPNYQTSFAGKADAWLRAPILSNRPAALACAYGREHDDTLN